MVEKQYLNKMKLKKNYMKLEYLMKMIEKIISLVNQSNTKPYYTQMMYLKNTQMTWKIMFIMNAYVQNVVNIKIIKCL